MKTVLPPTTFFTGPNSDGMARNIALEFPHGLGADAARQRVARRIDGLRAQFGDKISSSSVNWTGNEADIRVSALMQTATAQVLVSDTNVRIDIRLPLLLSPLSGKIAGVLTQVANDELRR